MKQLFLIGLLIIVFLFFFYTTNQQRTIIHGDTEELVCNDNTDNWVLEDEMTKYTEAVDEYINNK